MWKRFREALAENPGFYAVCGSLLLGIMLAFSVWFYLRPRSAFNDADAQKISYTDADEYRRVEAWEDDIITHRHQKKVSLEDVNKAAELLSTVGNTAKSHILLALCADGSGSRYESEITRLVLPYCADPDHNVRFVLALDLSNLHTPEAKAAYAKMKDDPAPEVRNEVRGQLGIANAK